jgi:hypothetical protein
VELEAEREEAVLEREPLRRLHPQRLHLLLNLKIARRRGICRAPQPPLP